jgi:nucleotide-binding universal stress UspA family protein
MAIRHILLPLTGESSSAAAAVCGLTLAKTLGAHVTAGYEDEMGPIYVAPDFGGTALAYGAFFEQLQKLRVQRKKIARGHFDRAVKATSLPIVSAPVCKQGSTMWLEDEAGSDAPIASFGPLTDLVVLEAPGNRRSPPAWHVVEEALFGARRPTLIVPPETTAVDLSRALIAWNGSSESADAVEHALNLLPETCKLIVLQIGDLKPGRMSSEKLMDYLGWHCFEAELRRVPDRKNETGQVILDEAARAGAGLIIMGAYTHSRTRELLLGGVTDHMLRQTTLPILMAH